jgi:queuine tRNA-ribosyltransferase subunit QTRTD1
MVSTGHHMLQMTLVTLVDHTKNVKTFGKGIAEFASLKIVDIVMILLFG